MKQLIYVQVLLVFLPWTVAQLQLRRNGAAGETIDLLGGAKTIVMVYADSVLTLSNNSVESLTFNLKKDFDPSGAGTAAGPKGIVELNSTGNGGLILKGDVGVKTLGIGGE